MAGIRRRKQRGGRCIRRTGRTGRGRRPTLASLLTQAGPLPTRRAPVVPHRAGRLPSTLMSTGWTGHRGSTSRRDHTRSSHTCRQTSKGGCRWHQSSRPRQHPGTRDASSQKTKTPYLHPAMQGTPTGWGTAWWDLAKRAWATGWNCPLPQGQAPPRTGVVAIPGGNNGLCAISVTPPTPLSRPRTVRGMVLWLAKVMRPVAGPVWSRMVMPSLVTARRTRACSSWPQWASELDETGSGLATGTTCGQKGSVKHPSESARVYETSNGSWSERVTLETGHTTPRLWTSTTTLSTRI